MSTTALKPRCRSITPTSIVVVVNSVSPLPHSVSCPVACEHLQADPVRRIHNDHIVEVIQLSFDEAHGDRPLVAKIGGQLDNFDSCYGL